MGDKHGDFIWYELLTSDADAAAEFYGKVIGWQAHASQQPDMDYRLFGMDDEEPVAGLMIIDPPMKAAGAVPGWLGYIGVDNVDASAKSIADAGGTIYVEPTDIQDVGRFAMVADRQSVPFYIMRSFSDEKSLSFSDDMPRVGHCAWNELSTIDQADAVAFYKQQFGWSQEGGLDMGPMGHYLFVQNGSSGTGAIMPKMPEMPVSAWTYYFRVPNIDVAVEAVKAGGGTILQEPIEIPGGDYSMNALDPQGAAFALVGSRP